MKNQTQLYKEGFTLVELTVVVAIIGIAATVALSSIAMKSPEYHVKNASWQLASDLRLARMQALSQNTNVEFSLDAANREYTIWTDSNRDGNVDSGEEVVRSLEGFKGANVYCYPASASFTPQGNLDSNWLYMYIRIQNYSVNEYQIIYVFPNGHIDPQGHNS